jgi:hypothetical protein
MTDVPNTTIVPGHYVLKLYDSAMKLTRVRMFGSESSLEDYFDLPKQVRMVRVEWVPPKEVPDEVPSSD